MKNNIYSGIQFYCQQKTSLNVKGSSLIHANVRRLSKNVVNSRRIRTEIDTSIKDHPIVVPDTGREFVQKCISRK